MRMSDLCLPEGVSDRSEQTPEEVALNLAHAVAGFLAVRLNDAARASLVVSGGSTPAPFFRLLSAMDLEWSRVDVLLADERWMDEDSSASNTRLIRDNLLQNKAATARLLSLKQPGATPAEGLEAVKAELANLT